MSRHDLAEWLVIVAAALIAWREIDSRWNLQLLWGWRMSPIRNLKTWICFRLTGITPAQPQISIFEHVAEHKLASLPWIILGSSRR